MKLSYSGVHREFVVFRNNIFSYPYQRHRRYQGNKREAEILTCILTTSTERVHSRKRKFFTCENQASPGAVQGGYRNQHGCQQGVRGGTRVAQVRAHAAAVERAHRRVVEAHLALARVGEGQATEVLLKSCPFSMLFLLFPSRPPSKYTRSSL